MFENGKIQSVKLETSNERINRKIEIKHKKQITKNGIRLRNIKKEIRK